jgi:thiamine pyrophosphate-dependent acetolactate synthase large subunit-like protein
LQASEEGFEKTLRWLLEANWPVIVADWAGRTEEGFRALVELAELLDIPVLDRGGRLNFPSLHPLNLTGQERAVLQEADLIRALDVADLHGALSERAGESDSRISTSLIPPNAKIIHADLKGLLTRSWAQDYDKLTEVDLPIHAETRVFLPELVRRLKDDKGALAKISPVMEQRMRKLQRLHLELQERLKTEAQRKWKEEPISCIRLVSELADVLKHENYVLAHGTRSTLENRFLNLNRFNQFIGRRWHGGVGVGLPISLGAALALKGSGKLCIGIQPDGDFLFGPSALWTAVHYEIPLLMIVFNNRSYYNDEEHQRLVALKRDRPVENRAIGIRLENPNVSFAKLAEAYEARGIGPVTEPGELKGALQTGVRALKETGRAVVIDVVTQNR